LEIPAEGVVQPDHLQADEYQDDSETVLQQVKPFHCAGEQKIESAQTKDCQNVGGEYNQRFTRQGKNGWNGIDGKNYVAHFDEQQNHQKRGRVEHAV